MPVLTASSSASLGSDKRGYVNYMGVVMKVEHAYIITIWGAVERDLEYWIIRCIQTWLMQLT